MKELVIYTDESEKRGRYYSNFCGGALVRSGDLAGVESAIAHAMDNLGLHREVKWAKVSAQYLDRYLELMGTFFGLVGADKVKLRVMFTQNVFVPTGLTAEQRDNEFFRLYCQFIKHAFGLGYIDTSEVPVRVRLYLDKLPDTREKVARFRGYVTALTRSPEFRRHGVAVNSQDVAEVRSHDHVVMQCLDVVLGSMQFRLNDKHLAKPKGARRRRKKTIAKHKLYKAISTHIRGIYPHFNIGISTGTQGDPRNAWRHSYRHWRFVPRQHRHDPSRSKA